MAVKGEEEEHQDNKAAVGRTAGMRGVEWTSMFAAKAKEGGRVGLRCGARAASRRGRRRASPGS